MHIKIVFLIIKSFKNNAFLANKEFQKQNEASMFHINGTEIFGKQVKIPNILLVQESKLTLSKQC